MCLLIDLMVLSGFVIACLFASSPTSTSSDLKATMDGVVLFPSAFAITVGSPPSNTATTLFVVPKSIPTAFPFLDYPFLKISNYEIGSCSLGKWPLTLG